MKISKLVKSLKNRCLCAAVLLGLFFWSGCVYAQIPSGSSLLSDGLTTLVPYGSGSLNAIVETVEVTGQSFIKALIINTFNKTTGGDYGLNANITTSLHRGDVLWISFKARCLESKRETGEAFMEVRFDQLVNGKYVWPPHLERGVSIGSAWTETSFPFKLTKDVKPEDVRFVIKFDSYPEKFELGPITFLNCGQDVKLSDLPRTVIRYDGGEPDAAWRKAADERIEKFRKGDLTIKVVDANGKPVKGADVTVNMKRNAFNWGTATNSQKILDANNPETKIYRDTLLKYFNEVVFENEMKWKMWYRVPDELKGVQTKKAVQWLKDQGKIARGHVMVWPSWKNSPPFLQELKNDTAALRAAILKQIKEQTSKMFGQFNEWDVVNEPFANHDILDILGWDEMVRWFKAAHVGAPGVKLFLNDYTMFHGKGEGSASENFFQAVRKLKEKGAPINAIGEQGHIGGTPPGIPYVLERLDYFATLGLPVQISEFDINSNDDDLKARYMGDFMTAIYSHPSTVGFVQWGFWEGMHWFPVAALWNKDWTIRKNGKIYTDLVTKKWWTNYSGNTSSDGTCTLRGFCGDYDIIVKCKGQAIQRKYVLENKGGTVVVNL